MVDIDLGSLNSQSGILFPDYNLPYLQIIVFVSSHFSEGYLMDWH